MLSESNVFECFIALGVFHAVLVFIYFPFLTRECAHEHERVIAIMVFSLGRLVGSVVNFRACAVNEF